VVEDPARPRRVLLFSVPCRAVFLPDPCGHRDVALGLCRSAGRVLLCLNARSARGEATRFWDLPGGAARPGESLKEALAREWQEEVGWRPAVGDLLLVVEGAKRSSEVAPPLYTWRAFVFDVHEPPFGTFPSAGPGIDRVEFVKESDADARLSAPYHAPLRSYLARNGPRYAPVSWVEPPDPAGAPPRGVDARTRRLLVIAAAAASGDAGLVATETAAAVAEGVGRATVEEALLQVVPYAGFPRTLAAFAAARPALGPAREAAAEGPPGARAADGAASFGAVYGDTADRVREGLARLHPLLPPWVLEFAYGRVLSRPALDLRTRELLAVSVLAAMGDLDDALLGHARAALRLGATADDLASAVAAVPPSAGEGRRAAAEAVTARA
jgi:4-carboxymuconolactone decarboxylase